MIKDVIAYWETVFTSSCNSLRGGLFDHLQKFCGCFEWTEVSWYVLYSNELQLVCRVLTITSSYNHQISHIL